MSILVETASAILSRSQAGVEIAAHNLANVSTPGFKRKVAFHNLIGAGAGAGPASGAKVDLSQGQLTETKNPYDLALSSEGFFVLRSDQGTSYTRHGQFRRDDEGRLIDKHGSAVQTRDGGDLVLKGTQIEITPDGVVLDGGAPIARIAVVNAVDPQSLASIQASLFQAPEAEFAPVEQPMVRQGMLEASNVTTGGEMIAIMESMRRAESAQRLMNVYDDLMGRALTAFGQS